MLPDAGLRMVQSFFTRLFPVLLFDRDFLLAKDADGGRVNAEVVFVCSLLLERDKRRRLGSELRLGMDFLDELRLRMDRRLPLLDAAAAFPDTPESFFLTR